eukprot:TRINITY_DN239_c0_g1_i4.p1 TRINITY_DN239_c0_g1~~TRINITY_DN239_c0_g1_i4.p1  ORF type:complete len:733 (-),score=170.53 TRINITY_DN239_c0_g1_i4:228-2426(-)
MRNEDFNIWKADNDSDSDSDNKNDTPHHSNNKPNPSPSLNPSGNVRNKPTNRPPKVYNKPYNKRYQNNNTYTAPHNNYHNTTYTPPRQNNIPKRNYNNSKTNKNNNTSHTTYIPKPTYSNFNPPFSTNTYSNSNPPFINMSIPPFSTNTYSNSNPPFSTKTLNNNTFHNTSNSNCRPKYYNKGNVSTQNQNNFYKPQNNSSFNKPTDSNMHSDVKSINVKNSWSKEERAAREEEIQTMANIMKNSQLVDLCFLIDCTGSMEPWIDAVKDGLLEIIANITKAYKDCSLRVAFVGYRDLSDKVPFSIYPFTTDLEELREWIASVRAFGGGDKCEDVHGGISKCLKLDWKNPTKMLFHITDSPSHGANFHNGCLDDYIHFDGDFKKIDELLDGILQNRIRYYFGSIEDSTTKMISVFNQRIARNLKNNQLDWEITRTEVPKGDLQNFVSVLTESVSTSITTTVKIGKEKRTLKQFTINTLQPSWADLEWKDVKIRTLKFPKDKRSLKEVFQGEMKKDIQEGKIKISEHPFAKGGQRIAFYGISHLFDFHQKTLRAETLVALKESKWEGPRQNNKRYYTDFIEVQSYASFCAFKFNKKIEEFTTKKLKFLKVKFFSIMEKDYPRYLLLEPYLKGDYHKLSNNWNYVASKNVDEEFINLSQCFSHFTLDATEGYALVTDIQGVIVDSEIILTDPAIHCVDITRFGGTNLSKAGIDQFVGNHECNRFCKLLNLRPLSI